MNPRILILIAVVLAVVLLVLGFLFVTTYRSDDARSKGGTSVENYQCDDDSFYLVVREEGKISIAGTYYAAVSDTRYERAGAEQAFVLAGDTLTAVDAQTGEARMQCARAGIPQVITPDSEANPAL